MSLCQAYIFNKEIFPFIEKTIVSAFSKEIKGKKE